MQKTPKHTFLINTNILKKWCAFVAFVSTDQKYANACNVCTLFTETMATIIYLNKIYLLPLLPPPSEVGYHGNKMLDHGNKIKIHCCRYIGQKCTIACNGGLKKQRQQKQQRFTIPAGVSCFPRNMEFRNSPKTVEIYE